MKYYIIKVKMGHVGRDKYLPMELAISAPTLDKAIVAAKKVGGVKRDHKDWCLESPKEVTYDEYLKYLEMIRKDPYWKGKTRANKKLFKDRLVDEKNYSREGNFKTNQPRIKKQTPQDVKLFKKKREEPIKYTRDDF